MVAPFTRSSKLTVPHLEFEVDCYRLESFTARLPLAFYHTTEGKEDRLIGGEEGSFALSRPPCSDYILMHSLLCSIAHTYNPSPRTKVAAVLFSYRTDRRDAQLTRTEARSLLKAILPKSRLVPRPPHMSAFLYPSRVSPAPGAEIRHF